MGMIVMNNNNDEKELDSPKPLEKEENDEIVEGEPKPKEPKLTEVSEQISLLKKFVKRNKLNDECLKALQALPSMEQNKLIAHFDPEDDENEIEYFFTLIKKKCPSYKGN